MLRRIFLSLFSAPVAIPFLADDPVSILLEKQRPVPYALLASHKPPVGSMDALAWAKSFVAHTKAHPNIATDEGAMIGWFANAIMAGYDEGYVRGQRDLFDERLADAKRSAQQEQGEV